MKKLLTVLILASLVMSGCSTASLQKAEENTRVTGMVPGGGIVYLPIWAASTIAGGPVVDTDELANDEEYQARLKANLEIARKIRERRQAEKQAKEAEKLEVKGQ